MPEERWAYFDQGYYQLQAGDIGSSSTGAVAPRAANSMPLRDAEKAPPSGRPSGQAKHLLIRRALAGEGACAASQLVPAAGVQRSSRSETVPAGCRPSADTDRCWPSHLREGRPDAVPQGSPSARSGCPAFTRALARQWRDAVVRANSHRCGAILSPSASVSGLIAGHKESG